jgi:hypothetical protein
LNEIIKTHAAQENKVENFLDSIDNKSISWIFRIGYGTLEYKNPKLIIWVIFTENENLIKNKKVNLFGYGKIKWKLLNYKQQSWKWIEVFNQWKVNDGTLNWNKMPEEHEICNFQNKEFNFKKKFWNFENG